MRYSLHSKVVTLLFGIAALSAGPVSLFAQSSGGVDTGGITILTVGTNSGPLTSFQAPAYEAQEQRKMMGAPKIGEATAVFNISQAGDLLAWVETVWNKGQVAAGPSLRIADQDYNVKRGLNMPASVITGIEFPKLKASDGKKHFEVTAKWQPQNLKFIGSGGRVKSVGTASPDEMLPSNFEVKMPGFPDEWIVSVTLPKITPKIAKESHGRAGNRPPVYDKPELTSLIIEISSEGIKSAEDLAIRILQDGNCEEAEFMDILIDMKDQSLKKVLGTFTLIGCGLKKFDWAPKLEGGKEGLATATLEFLVEDFRFSVSHK
jgi:hypothetical protein